MRDITANCAGRTEAVVAAVAYAHEGSLLFDWCWDQKIPLQFYGRLDQDVAVGQAVLSDFLKRKSPNFTCRLVEHHHAKVIWWKGAGLYIGSANLTQSAWNKNIEAGCFFDEDEITDLLASEINHMLQILHEKSAPLTEELFKLMKLRAYLLGKNRHDATSFWSDPSVVSWPGLITTSGVAANDHNRRRFLAEWHATLQDLRDIGAIVSQAENRPNWIAVDTPTGAQADQFLHAHYYQRTFDGQSAQWAVHHEKNRNRRGDALTEAIDWWRKLDRAPAGEAEMMNISAPYLRAALSIEALAKMDLSAFHQICSRVHAIIDYSRRVRNAKVHLPDGQPYTIAQKNEALAGTIWKARTGNGATVVDQLNYILYEGSSERLPERLWEAISSPKWKIEGLGISALGEIVGWALPEKFPPRNGRTSKALRSLGYDVEVHVG
ncbi:phospholipase D family protein [Methylobacterium oryzae CBMB20]